MFASIRNPKDFWTGALFISFGLAFLLIVQDYPMGSARRMGPAYFPTILSIGLILIGLATTVRSFLASGTAVGTFALKPMALVALGTVMFGVLVRDAGIVAAVVTLVAISASASTRFTWRMALLLAALLATFCVLVFVYGLGLPMPIIGSLLGG